MFNSERSRSRFKAKFPRLKFLRRQRQLDRLRSKHERKGHDWFVTANRDGVVALHPTCRNWVAR